MLSFRDPFAFSLPETNTDNAQACNLQATWHHAELNNVIKKGASPYCRKPYANKGQKAWPPMIHWQGVKIVQSHNKWVEAQEGFDTYSFLPSQRRQDSHKACQTLSALCQTKQPLSEDLAARTGLGKHTENYFVPSELAPCQGLQAGNPTYIHVCVCIYSTGAAAGLPFAVQQS